MYIWTHCLSELWRPRSLWNIYRLISLFHMLECRHTSIMGSRKNMLSHRIPYLMKIYLAQISLNWAFFSSHSKCIQLRQHCMFSVWQGNILTEDQWMMKRQYMTHGSKTTKIECKATICRCTTQQVIVQFAFVVRFTFQPIYCDTAWSHLQGAVILFAIRLVSKRLICCFASHELLLCIWLHSITERLSNTKKFLQHKSRWAKKPQVWTDKAGS